jgi:tetratricopeptide (TPR) repeat protein
VIEKIGGLDERFTPGNYEDDDFCLRAQLAGYKTVIAKDVFIHHYGSKSFKADGEKVYAKQLEINKQKFVDKWGVTPDELWLQNKTITPKQIMFPINKNKFIQFFERSRIQITDKDYLLALESLKNAIEHYGEIDAGKYGVSTTEVLDLAGNIGLIVGEIEKAKEYFEQELSLNPNSSQACVGLGEIFFQQGQHDNAKIMFEWAIKNDPNNSAAIQSLSRVNEIMGVEINHNSLMVEK